MTTQHTPSQWEQRAERFGRQTTHCVKIGNTLCHLTRGVGMTEHEMEANARLIAAAPALLAALKELRSYADLKLLQHRQDYPEEHCMVQTAIRMIATADKALADAQSNP